MQEVDQAELIEKLEGIYSFYEKDLTVSACDIWANAMRPFDLSAVLDALGRHAMNPDTGQFLPKPADVIRMMGGSTQDSALVAWSKVDRGVREIGPHQSVIFDDPIIHRVVVDMGGWVQIASKDDRGWPFIGNEFVTRYRGYRIRSEIPEYMPVLTGISDSANQRLGHEGAPPVLIGHVDMCLRVREGGVSAAPVGFTRLKQGDFPMLVPPKRKGPERHRLGK